MSSKNMKRLQLAVVILGLGFVIFKVFTWFSGFRANAFERSGKTYIGVYAGAQKAHKDEFGSYIDKSEDFKKCCTPLPPDYEIYASAEEMPVSFRRGIPEDLQPYLTKNSYRLLLSVKNEQVDEFAFWSVDEKGQPQKLSQRIKIQQ
ncbi:hypothetical protein D3C87_257960 [compost metagenome]